MHVIHQDLVHQIVRTYLYYSDFRHPATKLQPSMKETPYFSFKQADIVASHLNKDKKIAGDDDKVIHLFKNIHST